MYGFDAYPDSMGDDEKSEQPHLNFWLSEGLDVDVRLPKDVQEQTPCRGLQDVGRGGLQERPGRADRQEQEAGGFDDVSMYFSDGEDLQGQTGHAMPISLQRNPRGHEDARSSSPGPRRRLPNAA